MKLLMIFVTALSMAAGDEEKITPKHVHMDDQLLNLHGRMTGLLPTNGSRYILDVLLSAPKLTYLHSKDILDETKELPSMRQLQIAVTDEDRVFAVDFTDTNEKESEENVKKMFLEKLGIYFSCDLLIITRYKKGILFTPVDDIKKPDIFPLLTTDQLRQLMMRSTEPVSFQTKGPQIKSKHDDDQNVPNIAFYLNIQYDISDDECLFQKSICSFEEGKKVLCDKPHISLIFQVNLERSLEFGTSGSATPDAKIVRITADEDTGGAGIHLNDKLTTEKHVAPWTVFDGWKRDWTSSAIAAHYTVNVKSSNDKASVLKTVPQNNINPSTDFKEVSGFTLGVSGEAAVDAEGPKGKLGASASYNQQRWITFSTHDYEMVRSTDGPRHMKFKMQRKTYPKASDLLTEFTDPDWDHSFPADLGRVQPMGYASYVPKLDVVYEASSDEKGTTEFSVDASLAIMPLYHAAYQHYYVIGSHLSYHGPEYDRDGRTVSCKKSFTVNWEKAVFTGGRPVNLQSKAFTDKCIEVDDNGKIFLAKGDLFSEKQSFIYDEMGRYVSATNLKMCLDASNLEKLQSCGSTLTQRWEWEEESDHLRNVYDGKYLGFEKSTGKIGLYEHDSETVSTSTITAYTKLFTA